MKRPGRSKRAREFATRLPSERFFEGSNPKKRLREAFTSHVNSQKTLLEKSHEVPAWLSKVKQLSYTAVIQNGKKVYKPSKETIEVEQKIRSSDLNEYSWAEARLKSHFDYAARKAIKSFFQFEPNSLYTFEQIYRLILSRTFPYFLKRVKISGFSKASGTLRQIIKFRPYQTKAMVKSFKHNYLRKEDLPLDRKSKHIILLSPTALFRQASPERKNLDEIFTNVPLTEREKRVLEARYQHDMSQTEIAKELRISQERVRQIEEQAILKLRKREKLLPNINTYLAARKGMIITTSELNKIRPPEAGGQKYFIESLIKAKRLKLVKKGGKNTPNIYKVLK